MGDLDFDVRISTRHDDAAALISELGAALAHGTFRVPARLSTERALELVVVARSGAVAMKGKVEVLGFEGEHTWLRFLSASDHPTDDAHLILNDVSIELAQRRTARPAAASPPTRPPPPARGTRPLAPRVVAVPPRTRPTASHAIVEPLAEPVLAPAVAPEPRRQLTSSEIVPRPTTRATGVLGAVRVPPRPPPPGGSQATATPTPPPFAPAPPPMPSTQAPMPMLSAPAPMPMPSTQAPMPTPPALERLEPAVEPEPSRPASLVEVAVVRSSEDQAPPLPPPPSTEPVAQLPLESVVPWWNGAAPPPSAPAPAEHAAQNAPSVPTPFDPPRLTHPTHPYGPVAHSDPAVRFGTAPLETSQDAARAYLPEPAPPTTKPAVAAPLTRREKRVLGAACAIASLGFAVAGAALWSARPPTTSPSLATLHCEPTPSAAPPSLPAAAAAAAVAPSSAPEPSCLLQVNSNASLAEIWIDGERRGKVPAQLEVPCRPTSIALRHPRYQAAQRDVVPSPGTTEVEVRLTRPLVTVKIESKPPGANVRVNGRAIGKTPLSTKVLAFERGTVVLSHDGGAIKTMQIYPQADNTLVSATLPKPRTRPRTRK